MTKYSFLQEDLSHVLRKASKLPEQERTRLLQNYLKSRMATRDLETAKDLYGKRLWTNSLLRSKDNAKSANRRLSFIPVDDHHDVSTMIGGNYADVSRALRRRLNGDKTKLAKKVSNSVDTMIVAEPNKSPLISGYVNQHEADEYQRTLELAKKHGLSPAQVELLIRRNYDHAPGVLSREYSRRRFLDQLGSKGLEDLKISPSDLAKDRRQFNPDELVKKLSPEDLAIYKASGDTQILRNNVADVIRKWRSQHG